MITEVFPTPEDPRTTSRKQLSSLLVLVVMEVQLVNTEPKLLQELEWLICLETEGVEKEDEVRDMLDIERDMLRSVMCND